METLRTPYQGVTNIVRFNWHFYLILLVLVLVLIGLGIVVFPSFKMLFFCISALLFSLSATSLMVSHYIYDRSQLYNFNWIKASNAQLCIANISAGFDETSRVLEQKFTNAQFHILDFYNPEMHTEISIKRARKAYPPFPETQTVASTNLPLINESCDIIFIIFSAHEIRDYGENLEFFKELNRSLKSNGKLYIMEHLRDFPNFLAYTIGYFHFFSKKRWLDLFKKADLKLLTESKHTSFVSIFELEKA